MPFKSKNQKKQILSPKTDIAKKFAEEAPKSAYKKLKDHVSKRRKAK